MSASIHQLKPETATNENIGRFNIIREFATDLQGVVYLAQDPELERQVAIKVFDKKRQEHKRLIQEVRSVSKLEHPNIVPIYEIGVHEDKPYLVYQYCEGHSLLDLLQEKGKFKILEAVNLTCKLLDAIAYAHRNHIVHGNLNPSNILVDKNGSPRIMDFGTSVILGRASSTNNVIGKVNYMAPEQIATGDADSCIDIFSLGLILHEMLTGKQVFKGDNIKTLVYKITNENILPPSSREPGVEQKLDEIVMHALERELDKRYSNAVEMKADLQLYAEPNKEHIEAGIVDDKKSTVQFLLRRMQRRQDFPAISTNITQINKKTSRHDPASANELSNVILKDYALTTKLLRLVNSSFYGQFKGDVTTISRAVVILGFEQVRAAALSIILFEHLNNSAQANELKTTACSALMSGIISREQAKNIPQLDEDDTETVFIASLFHTLGRLLTIYYLAEEYEEIKDLVDHKGLEESQAVLTVLGAHYEDLGKGIAKEWQLPDIIVNSMRKLPEGPVAEPKSNNDRISQLASFSNELCALGSEPGNTDDKLEELAQRYNKSLKLSVNNINKLIETSKKELKEFTKILNVDINEVGIFASNEENEQQIEKVSKSQTGSAVESSIHRNNVDSDNEDNIAIQVAESASPENRRDILMHGITEITNTMLEDYDMNGILTMVLETIYRGMGFTRVLFCVRDAKNNRIIGRFGLGKDIDTVSKDFRFTIDDSDDILTEAVRKRKDFIVLDTNSDEYKERIPSWLRKLTMPNSLAIYPIALNKRCIGLLYADTDNSSTQISMDSLGFFKTLRNQATLAIQQKQMR